jgi:glycosyltransferase involved in cell wall biosynthesis
MTAASGPRGGTAERALSIVITTKNRSGLLREAIASVVDQDSGGLDLEVIVVDDQSTDDTAAVVRTFPSVRYVRVAAGSCGASRAAGTAQARGNWIAFLDDDDVWLPRVREFADLIRRRPEVRLVWSPAIVCDHMLKHGPVWWGPDLQVHGNLFEAFLCSLPAPSSIFVHRDVMQRCGGFSLDAGRAEDYDFFLRVARQAIPAMRLQNPSVLYRSREKPNATVILRTAEDSLRIVRRELSIAHRSRPSPLRRARSLLRLRGWHVYAMLDGARHPATSPEDRRKLTRAALRLSPLHALRGLLHELPR